jgi:hypothetical protein
MHQVNREKVRRWTGATTRTTALVAAGALSLGGLVAATTSASQARQPADAASVSPAYADTPRRTPSQIDGLRAGPDPVRCVDDNGDPMPCLNGGMPSGGKQFNRRFVQRKYGVVNSPRWLRNVRRDHWRKLHPWYFDGQAMRYCWLIDPRGGKWGGNRVCRDSNSKQSDLLRRLGERGWDYGVACGAAALVMMKMAPKDPRLTIGAGAAGCVGTLVFDMVRDINPFDRTMSIAEQKSAGRVNIKWKIKHNRVWSKYPGKRWRKR